VVAAHRPLDQDKAGQHTSRQEGKEMSQVITTAGKEWIVDKLTEGLQTLPEYVGWGTGSGGGVGSTNLVTPATEARVQDATLTQPTATSIEGTCEITCAGAGKTITEAGVFTAAGSGSPPSGGTLVLYADFTGIVLAVGDKIQFTYTISIT
jgi:hypothetical protein